MAANGALNCGWDKESWVVEPADSKQRGPKVTQSFSISEDKQHLFQTVHIAGGPFGNIDVHRVYNATN